MKSSRSGRKSARTSVIRSDIRNLNFSCFPLGLLSASRTRLSLLRVYDLPLYLTSSQSYSKTCSTVGAVNQSLQYVRPINFLCLQTANGNVKNFGIQLDKTRQGSYWTTCSGCLFRSAQKCDAPFDAVTCMRISGMGSRSI